MFAVKTNDVKLHSDAFDAIVNPGGEMKCCTRARRSECVFAPLIFERNSLTTVF